MNHEEVNKCIVIAKCISHENKQVKSIVLNSVPFKGFMLRHEDIMRGELMSQMWNGGRRAQGGK